MDFIGILGADFLYPGAGSSSGFKKKNSVVKNRIKYIIIMLKWTRKRAKQNILIFGWFRLILRRPQLREQDPDPDPQQYLKLFWPIIS